MHDLIDELCSRVDEEAGEVLLASERTGGMIRAWKEALRGAYTLAKADRARELRGDRSVPRFNEQGLHPFSAEWGRLQAIEALLPGLADAREKMRIDDDGEVTELFISTRVLRLAAREAAEAEYRDEIITAHVGELRHVD